MKRSLVALFALTASACSAPKAPPTIEHAQPPLAPREVTLTIVGTNDLHGHIESLPTLGGFVRVLRERRGAGSVLLLDAGDMFQGTLESNLGEGAAVVRGYDALGYDAAAIGNHEFDFGPAGPAATPASAADDPRGALEARAIEARFPFLSANLVDKASGRAPDWKNVHGHVIVVREGVSIAIVGVTSEDTPRTTIAANFVGLAMTDIASAITRESKAAHDEGATVVLVVSHAGGKCHDLKDPNDVASCDPNDELMVAMHKVGRGVVDAVVAGHTHQGIANYVEGVPIIESFATGHAFGRIDLTVDPTSKRVTKSTIFQPTDLRLPATYEGRSVALDDTVAAAIAPDVERARARKQQPIGVHLDTPITRSHDTESAEGNLFADLMRASQAGADVAMTNGGGLRADLPAGDLLYGAFFEAMPFDNRFATVRLRGADFRRLVTENLKSKKGILSLSGLRVRATCRGRDLDVVIERPDGHAIADDDQLVLLTTDFLATGGDGNQFGEGVVTIGTTLVRDALESALRARGGHLRGDDPALLDHDHPRLRYPGTRPVHCGN